MEFRGIFRYTDIEVNNNGHPTYRNCELIENNNWIEGNKIDKISLYNNLFLYVDIGKEFYLNCLLLKNIGEHKKGDIMDSIGVMGSIYMWKGDDMI